MLKDTKSTLLYAFSIWTAEGQMMKVCKGRLKLVDIYAILTAPICNESVKDYLRREIMKVWLQLPVDIQCRHSIGISDFIWILNHQILSPLFELTKDKLTCKIEEFYGK